MLDQRATRIGVRQPSRLAGADAVEHLVSIMADEHPRVSAGRATVYRLYDVGYEIDLARAVELVAPDAIGHRRPRRGEAAAIVTPRPPLTVELVTEPAVTAAIFDFGVVSMRLGVAPDVDASWADFVRFAAGMHNDPELRARLDRCVRELLERLGPAVVRPTIAGVTEEYIVFRAGKLCGPDGGLFDPSRLPADALARLLLNEPRPLSASALQDLLPHRFSYTTEDFVALTWESALVVEPDLHDEDVEYVLEFANAQLLELRVFDALLDAELPRLYDRVAAVRTASPVKIARPYRRLLAGLQTQVADVTEIIERAENAFKVTDDVYLARVYSAALEIFRGAAWRQGIDRKLGIMRETYEMLNAESQAVRAEALEIAIVLLIVLEVVLSFVRE
jgi:hypothetical protein